ncbi:hypothetical protein LTR51_007901 [Lithohypha guttulata]|nr:hypothetical protein LTR51_007901 [Lithohypha guttulata]
MWAHIGINAISTLLLSASNYAMQCFAAPTRADIDRAHQVGKWLDIGVPSLRNLRHIPRRKTLLWWMLALSSLPIYLLYNSVFYMSLSSNDYNVYFAAEQFIQDAGSIPPAEIVVEAGQFRMGKFDFLFSSGGEAMTAHIRELKNDLASFEKLDNAQCMRAYTKEYLDDRRTLILVSNALETNATTVHGFQYFTHEAVDASMNVYLPYDCLNASLSIVAVVAICNTIKLLIMVWLAFGMRHAPIMTVGDAITSFSRKPDETTDGIGLLSYADVTGIVRLWPRHAVQPDKATDFQTSTTNHEKQSWLSAASGARVTWTVLCVALSAVVAGSFLGLAIDAIQMASERSPFSFGFGKVNGIALASGVSNHIGGGTEAAGTITSLLNINDPKTRVLGTVVLANLPQLIFSLNYFLMNALVTIVYLAKEWNSYSVRRKPLRVSSPQGVQRSTYFLSLPYRVAVPLMIISGVMHWLISQSVFLAVVARYDPYGNLGDPAQVSTLGFSPLPMVITLGTGILLLLSILTLGLWRFKSVMPVASSCSAAIAAACHGPTGETGAFLKPVVWGPLPSSNSDSMAGNHYGFTSGAMKSLQGEGRHKK